MWERRGKIAAAYDVKVASRTPSVVRDFSGFQIVKAETFIAIVQMPIEIIDIGLSDVEFYRSGAVFFSVLAYPDQRDLAERDRYGHCLVRWSLQRMMEVSPDFAAKPQLIRPAYFSMSDREYASVLKRGNKRLHERLATAQYFALPHLRAIETGRAAKLEGFDASVTNMSVQAAAFLKLQPGSSSTVQSKMWAPTKPVAHAMCAYLVWNQTLWEKWGRNPKADRHLAFMFFPNYVQEVIELSEIFRAQITTVKDFIILEEKTIQFAFHRVDYGLMNSALPLRLEPKDELDL